MPDLEELLAEKQRMLATLRKLRLQLAHSVNSESKGTLAVVGDRTPIVHEIEQTQARVRAIDALLLEHAPQFAPPTQ